MKNNYITNLYTFVVIWYNIDIFNNRGGNELIDLKLIQHRIYQNKIKHNFNTTDAGVEFTNILRELVEALDAYHAKSNTLGEELADIIIFILGITAILNIDIEKELIQKLDINEQRVYTYDRGKFIKKQ